MKRFESNLDGWYCGWWNESALQINFAKRNKLYENETLHYHRDFCEYYLVVEGSLVLMVEGIEHHLRANQMIMVEPMEKHCVVWIAKEGCSYISIKSKSYKDNKVVVNQ